MKTVDEKLKSLQHDLLDKIAGKTIGMLELETILEKLERIAQIRDLNDRVSA